LETEEVLWKERQVNADKEDEEHSLGPPLAEGCAGNGRKSESHPSEDGEHRSYGQHVMKVRHYIICVMQGDVE